MKTLNTALIASAVALLMHAAPTRAELSNCTPAPNCGAPGKPCMEYVSQGTTETVMTSFLPGVSVIRVKLCSGPDAVCVSGNSQQTLSIFGYAGSTKVYENHLNTQGVTDTGPYTALPALTKLNLRCNATAGGSCKVVWQHCKESLPIQIAR
jgi:hypothetical protein